jgi:glycogen(starch) synthase
MRFSVVINTYNRAESLRQTLRALRMQTYTDFEVVVVNGPSTDSTADVLAEFQGAIRTADCPEVHLSKSRNAGIDAATGEVVAFIDDDGIPEPAWLADLAAAYDSARVGGAGGLVYDHTGYRLQYQYSLCSRLAATRFDIKPPFDQYMVPGADPFVYLQGTNCSFRRKCLEEIGGFDEEIEYYLDEVEVCMRIIDQGYRLQALDNAIVHHKYLSSNRRNQKRIVFNPYSSVKNQCYFCLQNGRASRTTREVFTTLVKHVNTMRSEAEEVYAGGHFTAEQRDFFISQVDRAFEVGVERGLNQERHHRRISPANSQEFRPFPTRKPPGRRLTVCFVSSEYPPDDFGGIGRYTADLATGFAAEGHEVHVVTKSPDHNRVDFEDGVWMHRLSGDVTFRLPGLDSIPLKHALGHLAAVYWEVNRIHNRGAIDVLAAPIWGCEGALCALDDRFPTVLTLVTTLRTIARMHPSWSDLPHVQQSLALERSTVKRAEYIHGISQAILEKVTTENDAASADSFVVPLGVRDRRAQYRRRRPANDSKVQVLFVGRLERRKGVDLLLESAVELVREFPNVEFILAGKDTPNTEIDGTYREAFQKKHGQDPTVAANIRFLGAVSEERLHQLYADVDIFCLPSRYESFGLVLVEAMVFGVPVIACAAGGQKELVEVDGNGLLAQPEDVPSLTECLRRLIKDPELRERMGKRSRQLFEEKYALDVVVRQTREQYVRIADSHRGKTKLKMDRETERLETVGSRYAEVIRESTGVAARSAESLGAGLVSTSPFSTNYLELVKELWSCRDDDFIRGLYRTLLGREADASGLSWLVERMRRGMNRIEVVRFVTNSVEGRRLELPTDWLKELTFTARMGDQLRSVPLFAKLARYAKRLIFMPWHFPSVKADAAACREAAVEQSEAWSEARLTLGQLKDTLQRQEQMFRKTYETLTTESAILRQELSALKKTHLLDGSRSAA